MSTNYIIWSTIYKVNHQNGFFKMYVSSHTNGLFYGSVLHYTRSGTWSTGSDVLIDMKLENFIDTSESNVYNQCEQWIQTYLPGNYSIELEKTSKM